MIELTRSVDGIWRLDHFDHPNGMHWITKLTNDDFDSLIDQYLEIRKDMVKAKYNIKD